MRSLLAWTVLAAFANFAWAGEWESAEMKVKLNLPDSSEWAPFKSGDPNAKVGLGRKDRTAMIVVTGKLMPSDSPMSEMTEPIAREFAKALSGTRQADPSVVRVNLGGTPAYRFGAVLSVPPDPERKVYRDFLVLIHNHYLLAIDLMSVGSPVAANKELAAVTESIRLVK